VLQVAEEQAALDALSELGMQQGGVEAILLHPCQVIQDVTSKALGRAPSPDVTLAAVHALATVAGHPRTPLLAHPRAHLWCTYTWFLHQTCTSRCCPCAAELGWHIWKQQCTHARAFYAEKLLYVNAESYAVYTWL